VRRLGGEFTLQHLPAMGHFGRIPSRELFDDLKRSVCFSGWRFAAIEVWDSLNICRIPKSRPACHTLRTSAAQILAYFERDGVNNGATEAINPIMEKVRRLAHGFKDFDHLPASIPAPSRRFTVLPEPP
jgi:hypothetical protein